MVVGIHLNHSIIACSKTKMRKCYSRSVTVIAIPVTSDVSHQGSREAASSTTVHTPASVSHPYGQSQAASYALSINVDCPPLLG